MREYCPICNNEVNYSDKECPLCGFTDLHKIFESKAQMDKWFEDVVSPYREKWKQDKHLSKKQNKDIGINLHDHCCPVCGVVLENKSPICNNCKFDKSQLGIITNKNIEQCYKDVEQYKNLWNATDTPDKYFSISQDNILLYTRDMMENMVFPRRIVGIQNTAISEYKNHFENIKIGDGIKGIGCSTFKNCECLETVILPKGVEYIKDEAFANCKSLKFITLPDDVEYIGSCAFKDCTSLKSIVIPPKCKIISDSAFEGCISLENIIISENDISIGKDAFKDTGYYNTPQNWENNLLYINNYLVAANENIIYAKINNGTKYIANNCFTNCNKLRKAYIPDTVVALGKATFANSSIEIVEIDAKLNLIPRCCFKNCSRLIEINIPDNVTKIEEMAFKGCELLINVSIPPKLEVLEEQAFEGCRLLKQILLPASLEKLGMSAFGRCELLRELYVVNDDVYIDSALPSYCGSYENLIIKCNSGSNAHKYAVSENIKFDLL